MACTRFLRSVWIFGFCLGKLNYEVLRNQVGNLDIVFIGNVVINHLISDEELNIRSFRLRNVTTATRPTHQVYSIFSAQERLYLKEETSRYGYSVHGKCNFTSQNAPVNGEISSGETGPESGKCLRTLVFGRLS